MITALPDAAPHGKVAAAWESVENEFKRRFPNNPPALTTIKARAKELKDAFAKSENLTYKSGSAEEVSEVNEKIREYNNLFTLRKVTFLLCNFHSILRI